METTGAASGFAALSQETRLKLIRLLATAGATGMAAGEIAARLSQQPSTLSFHLSALEQAGLVQSTRQGRNVRDALPFCRGVPIVLKSLRQKDYSESPQTLGEHLKKRRRKS